MSRYLGLDIDSIKIEIRLPVDKLEKLINLGGLLAHCSHVVDGGRTHSKRFNGLYKVILKNDLKRLKLGKAARKDLGWWLKFCATFNGKRKIEYDEYPIPLTSDSSMKGLLFIKGSELTFLVLDEYAFNMFTVLVYHTHYNTLCIEPSEHAIYQDSHPMDN